MPTLKEADITKFPSSNIIMLTVQITDKNLVGMKYYYNTRIINEIYKNRYHFTQGVMKRVYF